MPISITLIGGPTALIEIDGFRLLTDPTFDAPGAYQLPHVTLEKTIGPALKADAIAARSMPSCSATTSTRTISTIPAARFSNTQSAC
ncbi:L-ascorbate metabolism protein UlaG (beta-lactamase superfamily) [Bradyrhizobium sp. i1.7.7]